MQTWCFTPSGQQSIYRIFVTGYVITGRLLRSQHSQASVAALPAWSLRAAVKLVRLLGRRNVSQAPHHLRLGARLSLFLPMLLLQSPQFPVSLVVLLLFALRSVACSTSAGSRSGQVAAALETAPAWPLQSTQPVAALKTHLQVKLVTSSTPRFQVVGRARLQARPAASFQPCSLATGPSVPALGKLQLEAVGQGPEDGDETGAPHGRTRRGLLLRTGAPGRAAAGRTAATTDASPSATDTEACLLDARRGSARPPTLRASRTPAGRVAKFGTWNKH